MVNSVVHHAHNGGQDACTFGDVESLVPIVHSVYMPRAPKPKKPRFSRHFLKEWRLKKGLTQEELGALIGRSHATVQRIETRQTALTQPVLDELALALKTSRGKILDEPPAA